MVVDPSIAITCFAIRTRRGALIRGTLDEAAFPEVQMIRN